MALINTTTTGVLGTTVYGDGAGALTVQKDGVTQGVYGNIPAFLAGGTGSQTLSNDTAAKVTILTVESFDTNSNYDNSACRFTPTVAGYYQCNAVLQISGSSTTTRTIVYIYKNNTDIAAQGMTSGQANSQANWPSCAGLIYMNGTTDYLEVTGHCQGTGTLSITGAGCKFSAVLVKAV